MPNESQIRELAYSIWEQEGRPQGRDWEHYFRAKRALDEREAAQAQPAAPRATAMALPAPRRAAQLKAPAPAPTKRQTRTPRTG